MRQRFFTNTIQSKFIKSLLYNTPLPNYNTVKDGDYIIKGQSYIFNRSVIKCTKSGYLAKDFNIIQSWNTNSGQLGALLLNESILGISGDTLPIATSGMNMIFGQTYLLGSYNYRYNLDPEDDDYPIYNPTVNYSKDQIVQYKEFNTYHLYEARENIPAGTPWSPLYWKYLAVSTSPYYLVQCTETGVLDALPVGATYKLLQEFEPETIDQSSNKKLSPQTYYILYKVVNGVSTLNIVFNENLTAPNQTIAEWFEYTSFNPYTYYTKFTHRFISSDNYYDSETHRELGNYLRFYRDFYNVDLMAYYNCWDGQSLDSYQIYNNKLTKMKNKSFRVLQIPIRFNKTYTIAIDSISEVKLVPAIMKFNNFISVQVGQSNKILLNDILDDPIVHTYSSLSFSKPIIYTLTNLNTKYLNTLQPSVGLSSLQVNEFLQRYENCLYLIIQLPKDNVSSVVVLEGDYTNINSEKIFNMDNLNQMTTDSLNNALTNHLSLLQINDGNTYPFADRLIEYLLANVINDTDQIGEDIERVRQKLNSYLYYDTDSVAWSDYLRILLFDKLQDSKFKYKFDLSGYVDKDAEQYVNQL